MPFESVPPPRLSKRADEDCVAVEAKDEEEGAVDVDDEVPLPGGLNGSRNTALLSPPPPLALLVVLSEDITTTGMDGCESWNHRENTLRVLRPDSRMMKKREERPS